MRKLISRWLNLGTASADQISARTFDAGFTPTNITPVATAGESVSKISAYLKGIDNRLADISAGVVNYSDQYFTGNGSASRVTLSTNIGSGTAIDVWANGGSLEEGVDFARDAANDQLYALDDSLAEVAWPSGVRLRVRVYSSSGAYTDEFFSGGSSPLTVSLAFAEATRIDVSFNGVLMEEGVDWTRNTTTNTVSPVSDPTTSSTRIRVRIWN